MEANETAPVDETNPTQSNASVAPAHEVDSAYAKRDVKLPREKSQHKILKVVLTLLIALLLILGGLAVWFFAYYNQPEKVALDAVQNLFQAENVAIDGDITILFEADDSALEKVDIDFGSASDRLPNASSADIIFSFKATGSGEGPQVRIKVSNVILRDGVLYLQLAGLMDSIEGFGLSPEVLVALEDVLAVVEVIDNEWWRIDVRDVLNAFELPDSQVNAISDVYSCMIDAGSSRGMLDDLAEAYRAHRFVQVAAADTDAIGFLTHADTWQQNYHVTLDKSILADFVNTIPETEAVDQFIDCYNRVMRQADLESEQLAIEDIDEISADDVDLSDDLKLSAKISTFGHQLQSLTFYQAQDGVSLSGGIDFTYQAATVTAPDSYRPISELVDELSELLVLILQGSAE